MTPPGGAWELEHVTGAAHELHQLDDPAKSIRTVRVLTVTGSAVVLGSSQSVDAVDADAARRSGVEVVRRRSGGGAVLLEPQRQAWVDLLVPRQDPLWRDDVIQAAWWVGELWASVADTLTGESAGVVVHRGRLRADVWGQRMCFAGIGPGEVLDGGRKIVGVSQRRSRDWTRIQTMAPVAPTSGIDLVDLLALSEEERYQARAVLSERAAALNVDLTTLLDAVVATLPN